MLNLISISIVTMKHDNDKRKHKHFLKVLSLPRGNTVTEVVTLLPMLFTRNTLYLYTHVTPLTTCGFL